MQEQKKTRVCHAPLPTHPALAPSIYSIEIEENLEVEWLWTHFPDGGVVTGYRLYSITKRDR
jgi:hypothetical protein